METGWLTLSELILYMAMDLNEMSLVTPVIHRDTTLIRSTLLMLPPVPSVVNLMALLNRIEYYGLSGKATNITELNQELAILCENLIRATRNS